MHFLKFLDSLNNPEKTRNFNRFKNYSLEPFRECLEKVIKKHPDFNMGTSKKFSIIGTNGKGSLGYYLQTKLLSTDSSVGFYSSPHLVHPLERIQIQGSPITEEAIETVFRKFNAEEIKYLQEFTYFEIFTLFSIITFRSQMVKWQIFEAGLGGRLDATKLTEPDYVVLTKIGLDHTEILGKSKDLILREKLGILSHNTKDLFVLEPSIEDQPTLMPILEDASQHFGTNLHFFRDLSRETNYLENYKKMADWIIQILSKTNPDLTNISRDDHIPTPPGRMEILQSEPYLIYDTAHNPQAVENLLENIERMFPLQTWKIFLACLPDKDLDSIIKTIRESKNVAFIKVLTFPPFQSSESIPTEFRSDSISDLYSFFQEMQDAFHLKQNSLIMGSFRVYPMIKDFISKS